jgi:hypothetical protein
MTRQASGDKVQLVAAGVAVASAAWRGGRGVLTIASFNAGGNFEMQAPDGAWVGVKDLGAGTAITTAANGAFNFSAPACRIRMSAGGGSMNVVAVGV